MNKQYIKYMASLLLFGSNGIVASYIALNSYEIVLSRTFIGSLFLLAIFLFTKQKRTFGKQKKDSFFLVLSGAAMGASWMCLFEAYAQVGVSVATLAYYCGPVLVIALSPLLFRETMTLTKLIGFVGVLIGMLFVNGTQLFTEGFSWGLVCGILSAVLYAVMIICNKKATSFSGLENTICQLVVSCILVAVFTFFRQGIGISIPSTSICPVLFLGVVNTGLGCYLYFSSIQQLSAQTVSVCSYLDPFSALLFSAIFLHEKLSVLQLIGAVLILGGAAFCELYQGKKQKVIKQ